MNYHLSHVDERAVLGIAIARFLEYLFNSLVWAILIPLGFTVQTIIWLISGKPFGLTLTWDGRLSIGVGLLVIASILTGIKILLACIVLVSFVASLVLLANPRVGEFLKNLLA